MKIQPILTGAVSGAIAGAALHFAGSGKSYTRPKAIIWGAVLGAALFAGIGALFAAAKPAADSLPPLA